MRQQLTLLILALLTLATLQLGGCKKSAPDVDEALQLYPWEGDLIELLPPDYRSWVYVDIAALREQPRVGALLDAFIQYAPDAFTIALFRGNEALFGLPETPGEPILGILRSDFISAELRAGIQRGAIEGNPVPAAPARLAGHHASQNEAGTQWMAAPTPNLLLSGPEDRVESALRALAKASPVARRAPGADVVFALPFRTADLPALAPLMEREDIRTQAEAIDRVTGALRIDDQFDLTARFAMPRGGSPEDAAVIFAMFIEHSLPALLATWLNEDLATWLSRQFTVLSENTADVRGVTLRVRLDSDALDLLLTLLEALIHEE